MTTLDAGLLEAVKADPGDDSAWLVLADWLEEDGRLDQAELMRLSLRLRRPGEDELRPAREARLQELLRQRVVPVVPTASLSLGEGVELSLVLIPPGTFWMGSPADEPLRDEDEGPRRRVRITKGFWLGAGPVTQAQWSALMGDNPAHFRGADLPVEMVSWDDGNSFCDRLSERSARRVRFPTEAEWEYACRAGTTSAFFFGQAATTDEVNYDGTGESGAYRERTSPVGELPPNAFGVFDMHGNVWECCADWYDADFYERGPEDDPAGPPDGEQPDEERSFRGGSWFSPSWYCRAACRGSDYPDSRDRFSGFRVALDLP